jgi:hypothetical protein
MTSTSYYFNISLHYQHWDMVVYDNIYDWTGVVQPELMEFVQTGGKLILSTWSMTSSIWTYFGIEDYEAILTMPPDVYFWDHAHPMFNIPAQYGLDMVNSTMDIFSVGGTYALNFTTYANATAYAGYSAAPDGGAGIIISANGRAIINGPLITCYGEDADDSTYMDAFELWTNQIGFLYYDRPTIDHPADVTYMETEVGNEITWTPSADAGPWEYAIWINGSTDGFESWDGSAITINVDGVNASITTYEILVRDRLGYEIGDEVILNVTEYVAPGPSIPFDPTLLLIIGGAALAIVVILVIFMKKKKE